MKLKKWLGWSYLATLVCGVALLGATESDPRLQDGTADLVLLDGKVITVDPKDTLAQAVAIKNGRILAVGTTQQIERLVGNDTKVIHLGGKAVLPGFIDAHTHLEGIAAFHRMLDVHVPPLRGVEDILAKVRERVSAAQPGEWVVGAGGWGQPLPTREQLDTVAPDIPVVLRESAHVQILNSKALQLLGIDKNYTPPVGGHVYRDAAGEPTGKIQEMPAVWLDKVPPPSYEVRRQSLQEVMEYFRSMGVTTIYDFPSGDTMKIYQDLRDAGQLPVRLRYQIILTGQPPAFADFVFNYGPRTGFGDDWLRLGGIKLFVDGETESALRYDPPGQREKWVGDPRYNQAELNDIVMRAHKAGFQVWTHALGDHAQDMILEAYERAEKAVPRPDPRFRIEHAGNQEAGPTTAEQLDRMKRVGVIPVPTAAWLYLGHAAFKTQAPVPFIYKTMLAHGLRPPGSSDSLGSMPESMSPFFSMWCMVTRKTRDGTLNGPSEAISILQAIHGYTIDGAYSGFEDKIKGSIEQGKLADLNVLSADPLTVPSDQIKDIKVLTTVLDGKVVAADGAEAQVKEATSAFYAALNRADPIAAARFLLPGGDSFPRTGKELDPEAPTPEESLHNLQRLFGAGLRFNVTLRDLRVRMFDSVGVATFYTAGVTTGAGRSPSQGEYRATYVWVRKPDGWKIAHFHISPLVRS